MNRKGEIKKTSKTQGGFENATLKLPKSSESLVQDAHNIKTPETQQNNDIKKMNIELASIENTKDIDGEEIEINGNQYIGELNSKEEAHGHGRLESDEELFEGEFKNNRLKNGRLTIKGTNEFYNGEFKDDVLIEGTRQQ